MATRGKISKNGEKGPIYAAAWCSVYTDMAVVDPLHSIPYQGTSVVELELLFDVGAVGLHSFDAHMQHGRDMTCTMPCTN